MASIRQDIVIEIEASPEQVWAAVREIGAVHRRRMPVYHQLMEEVSRHE